MRLPRTLTEAQAASQIKALERGPNRSQSSREVPYEEIYRASSGVMETPAQRLQRVVTEDEVRERERKSD